jgi:hypothetical protein
MRLRWLSTLTGWFYPCAVGFDELTYDQWDALPEDAAGGSWRRSRRRTVST